MAQHEYYPQDQGVGLARTGVGKYPSCHLPPQDHRPDAQTAPAATTAATMRCCDVIGRRQKHAMNDELSISDIELGPGKEVVKGWA